MGRHRFALTVMLGLVLAVAAAIPASAATIRFRVTMAPSPMSLGTVPVGTESVPQILYATNRSPVPLRWVRSEFQARPSSGLIILDLAPAPANCFDGTDWVIQPGQTCGLVKISFKPDTTGTFYVDGVNRFTDGVTTVTATSTAKGKAV